MLDENAKKFLSHLSESMKNDTFVKMTLGNYRGNDPHLQKLLIRLIETKKGSRFFFLHKYETRDTAKNYSHEKGLKLVEALLGSEFFAGHLFTTENNFQLDIGKKGKSRLNVSKPTFTSKPALSHDKDKKRPVDPRSPYLAALGITNDVGEIKSQRQNKWKQINKFIETLSSLVEKSSLKEKRFLKIVDMGCGKGYLTFAAYDYFSNKLGVDVEMHGVDTKKQLVDLCNDVAKTLEFTKLRFFQGDIENFEVSDTDILIALHACNTATDEAIYKGIIAGAELIVVAPCCHQELRPQIVAPDLLKNILKHGVIQEREAESITDGLRSLLLESKGYSTKIFEFISTEHTPKNNMIVGTKAARDSDLQSKIVQEINAIKDYYGIKSIRLEQLLKQNSNR